MRRRFALATATWAVLLVLQGGCNWVKAAAYYFGPERRQEAHIVLTAAPLAVVIDGSPRTDDHPLFRRALHQKVVELFEANGVNEQVVPYARQLALQQEHPDYRRWSLQRIGRELEVAQVVQLQIVEFRMRDRPDYPVLQPEVKLRIKVIDTQASPADARVWPAEVDGFELEVKRLPSEAGDMELIDTTARKLGVDTAQWVARLFYEHSLEETVPVEP